MKIIKLKDWKKDNARKAPGDVAKQTPPAERASIAMTPRTEAPGIVEIGKGRVGVDVARKVLTTMGLDGAELEKQLDTLADGDLLATYTMSTDDVDRPGDRILQDGWDLNEFRANPVMLFVHDAGQLPIGKAIATYLSRNALKGTFRFASESVFPFGAMVGRIVKAGFMNAGSVGFMPTEWRVAEDRVDPDDPWSEWFPPLDFIKQLLLEFSACPIPANPHALVDAKGLASADAAALRSWAERTLAGSGGRALVVPRDIVEQMTRLGKKARLVFDAKAEGEPVARVEEEGAAGEEKADTCVCPSCGHEGPMADFVPKPDEDEKELETVDTKALLAELKRRGIAAPSVPAPTPAPDPEVLPPAAALPNQTDPVHPVGGLDAGSKALIDHAIKVAVDEAMMQRTGKLPV